MTNYETENLVCFFCSMEFAVESIDVVEEINFCPFCGNELLDEGMSEDEEGN